MEFELVERPQSVDILPLTRTPDRRRALRPREVPPRYAPDWCDRAVLIPDQEYGS